MVATILMSSTELEALRRILYGEHIVYILRAGETHVCLGINVPATKVDRSRLRKRQVQFKLPHSQT